MARKILTDTGGFASRYSAAIVATVIVMALIAKARDIPLWKPWPWKALYVLLAIICILGLLFSVYLTVTGVYISAALLLCGAILLAPALQQLYQYSYKSPELWNTTNLN